MIQRLCRWTVVWAFCGGVLYAADVAAQEAASIVGQVTDESGAVLPGVTVTARSPSLQVPRVAPSPTPLAIPPDAAARRDLHRGIRVVRISGRPAGRSPADGWVHREARHHAGSRGAGGDRHGIRAVAACRRDVDDRDHAVHPRATRGAADEPQRPPVVDGAGAGRARDARKRRRGHVQPARVRVFGQGAEPWYVLEGVFTTSLQTAAVGQYWDYNAIEDAAVQTIGTNAEVGSRGVAINA